MLKTMAFCYICFLFAIVGVILSNSRSISDTEDICDGVCWNCLNCRKCHQKMCDDDRHGLMFKENCCFRIHKDDMTSNCKRICFSEDEKLQLMAEEIINIRRQLGEKNKQLKAKDGEIKELNERIKGFKENVNNDIQLCDEAKTTDETVVRQHDEDCPVFCPLAVFHLCVIVISIVVVFREKISQIVLVVWLGESISRLASCCYKQFPKRPAMWNQLCQYSNVKKKTENYNDDDDDESKPCLKKDHIVQIERDNEDEHNYEIIERNKELNHTDVTKEKQANETIVSAQINSQNEYDAKDEAVNIQRLDSSNNAPENIVNKAEKVLSGDCDDNALENVANNDSEIVMSSGTMNSLNNSAEESRDNAENVHRRDISQNYAEESKDGVMHIDSDDILNNSTLSDESSNNPTEQRHNKPKEESSNKFTEECPDKISVEESGSAVGIENISATVADVSDSVGQNAVNRAKLDPPSASCGLPDQQDERNTPDTTRMNNSNQDEEERIKNGLKGDDVLPTDMSTCHLNMEIYKEKHTNSNTLPSQSEEQL